MPLVRLARRPWAVTRARPPPHPYRATTLRARPFFSLFGSSSENDAAEGWTKRIIPTLQKQDPHGRITMQVPRQFMGFMGFSGMEKDISAALGVGPSKVLG